MLVNRPGGSTYFTLDAFPVIVQDEDPMDGGQGQRLLTGLRGNNTHTFKGFIISRPIEPLLPAPGLTISSDSQTVHAFSGR